MADYQTSDDLYSVSQEVIAPETRTMAEVLRIAMDQAIRDMSVWLPGQVVNVLDNSTVNVKPCIMEKFRVQGVIALPILQNVPVEHPRGADYWVKLPVAAGDYGRIVFCDRSLDNWIVSGGVVDPEDPRMHHLSDAVFVPGLFPQNNKLPGDPTEMILHNGSAEIHIQKPGTFLIKNQNQELLNLLDQLLNILISETYTNTLLGPQPFINYTVQLLTTLRQNLDTLKGS